MSSAAYWVKPTTTHSVYTRSRDYIAPDMRQLLFDFANWDAAKAGWYNMPTLHPIRDPIHGTRVGSSFPKALFPRSGLEGEMTTHVLVYYDDVAATSLQNVWERAA
jgi:hypothetical protein